MNPDPQEREALEFLYAYMSLGDMMNNTPEFYRECVDCTRRALDADSEGCSGITVGNGDMLVYASDETGRFGFAESAAGDSTVLTIVLDSEASSEIPAMSLDIVPPPEKLFVPEVKADAQKANADRIIEDDNIRCAYTATFRTAEQAGVYAAANGLERCTPISVSSQSAREKPRWRSLCSISVLERMT